MRMVDTEYYACVELEQKTRTKKEDIGNTVRQQASKWTAKNSVENSLSPPLN